MNLWQHRETWYVIFALVAAFFVGVLLGYPFMPVALLLGVYSIRHLINVRKLHRWLQLEDNRNVPEGSGVWSDIFNELFLKEKQSGGDKYRLTSMLNRFQEAAAAFPDGMLILSSANKIEWANPTACDMLGITMPRDTGRPLTNLFRHPEFIEHLKRESYGSELTLPSQERTDNIITLQVIPFGFGRKLLIARDVTHIIKLEEMRSNFVANVSHELRTPVTVICGYLETIKFMPEVNKELLSRPVDTMYAQAKRMDHLVRDLLALAKLETEPVHKEKSMVDVAAMLESLKEAALLLSGDREHQITFEVDDKLMLNGRRDELQSLFSNIVNNAIRYTPPRGHIRVKWARNSKDEPVFSVQDDGPGIAREHIPHLTERFYRVNADRSRETGGTGLGLAIVKHVLERHGGELRINSQLGKGTEFVCIFPQISALRQSA